MFLSAIDETENCPDPDIVNGHKMMNPPIKEEKKEKMGRLAELDAIERELASSMHSASAALQELSKDVPKPKQVETHTNSFLASLHKVDMELNKQIHYLNQVSSGQSHEGSVYASAKTLSMGRHRIEHGKLRLAELDRVNAKYNALTRDHPLQQQIQAQYPPQHGPLPPGAPFAQPGGPVQPPSQGPLMGHQPLTGQPPYQSHGPQMTHQHMPPQSPYYNPNQQGYHQ